MRNVIHFFSKHLIWLYFLIAFFALSVPFVHYPLTDGDIGNWLKPSLELHHQGHWLSGENDQGHGPLMVWLGAVSLKFFGFSFYSLNFFNLCFGMLFIVLLYRMSNFLWNSESVSRLAVLLGTFSLAPIYLSHTPMYDWPAAVCYFSFACGYYVYVKTDLKRYFFLALLMLALGSLSRFSIMLGLSFFFVVGVSFIHKRSLFKCMCDLALIGVFVLGLNLPWFIAQTDTQGVSFVKAFVIDNFGRYFKSTRPHDSYRFDWYGFPLYVLVGLFPFTIFLLNSVFQKGVFKRILDSKTYQMLLVGFLPCLILFSFSGHTKLGRYISYVFPFILLWMSHLMHQDLLSEGYRKRVSRGLAIFSVLFFILLGIEAVLFSVESQSAPFFVLSVLILVFSLLFLTFCSVKWFHPQLREGRFSLFISFACVYMIFFSCLSYFTLTVPFLMEVREKLLHILAF